MSRRRFFAGINRRNTRTPLPDEQQVFDAALDDLHLLAARILDKCAEAPDVGMLRELAAIPVESQRFWLAWQWEDTAGEMLQQWRAENELRAMVDAIEIEVAS